MEEKIKDWAYAINDCMSMLKDELKDCDSKMGSMIIAQEIRDLDDLKYFILGFSQGKGDASDA